MNPSAWWLWTHFGLVLAGLACLLTSVLAAALYLWQSRQLKSKHPGWSLMRLPSLEALDRVHFRSLLWGAGLFSVGLLAGVVWATDLDELNGVWRDPRALLSLATCGLAWVIASLRVSALRRGQKIAAGTLVVFVLLSLTIASSYVAPGAFHGGV